MRSTPVIVAVIFVMLVGASASRYMIATSHCVTPDPAWQEDFFDDMGDVVPQFDDPPVIPEERNRAQEPAQTGPLNSRPPRVPDQQ